MSHQRTSAHRGPHDKLRIAVVTQYFAPEDVPIPTSIPIELARRGHRVRVITGYPNYPTGKLFPGYRQGVGRIDQYGGFEVMRVPIVISHSQNALGRILNYLSFGLGALLASRFIRQADVVYVYATQMTAAIAPMIWRRTRRTPFVLHVQDLWPESITGSGMVHPSIGRAIEAVLRPWLSAAYRTAAATIGISPTMTRALVERGVPASRAHTVYNWAPPSPSSGVRETPLKNSADSAKNGRLLRLMYAGNLGEMQDLDTLLRAMQMLAERPVTLDVFGDGVMGGHIRRLAHELDLDSVRFHGQVRHEVIEGFAAEVDFQIVTLKDLPVFSMTIPSKFQAGLALGLPVITNVPGDLAKLVHDHGVGFTARPGDPRQLADAITKALHLSTEDLAAMSARTTQLHKTTMSLGHALDEVVRILQQAARGTVLGHPH